jgi:SAM-dependent methyltransferase
MPGGLRLEVQPRLQVYAGAKPLFTRDRLRNFETRVARRLYGNSHDTDEHWIRETMLRDVDRFVRAIDPHSRRALEISGNEYAHYPWSSYESRQFPAFDLCNPGPIEETYDIVFCDQVLEHVVDPFTAARTLATLCAPGGYVVVGVPFLVRVHLAPRDLWRFSEDGLTVLLEQAALDVVEVKSWGNRQCVRANFLVWAKRPRWASTANEPQFPVNVWAIARKPVATS